MISIVILANFFLTPGKRFVFLHVHFFFFTENFFKYGDIFSLYIFGERMTMLCDAEGIELFFKSDPDTFSAKEAYKFTIPVFGQNVVYDSPPDTLVEQKRFMKGGLTTQRFQSYVHTIST